MGKQYIKLKEHVAKTSRVDVIACDTISNSLQNATESLHEYNEARAMRKPFFAQKTAIKHAVHAAESLAEMQKKLDADPQRAAIYAKICAEWDDEPIQKKETPNKYLAMNLLVEVNCQDNHERYEEFRKLQREHRTYLIGIKEKISANSLLFSKFSETMKEWDENGEKLLEQILNVD